MSDKRIEFTLMKESHSLQLSGNPRQYSSKSGKKESF